MNEVTQDFQPDDATFNRANALYLAHASDVAYLRSPKTAARERLGLTTTVSFLNKVTRTRGFLGVCDTHAVLAFRGTEPMTLPNWLTDVVVRLAEHDEYHGRVHQGFGTALRRSWGTIEPLLDEVGDKPLFLTGHSMGGALAVLTACRFNALGRPPVATYTFGSPRIGDGAFCAGYTLPTYRVVNRLDFVPEMPLASARQMLQKRLRETTHKVLKRFRVVAEAPCYGHVKTFVYIDRDGEIHTDVDVEPWYEHAIARMIATRGVSIHEGVTDHLISNYIRGLKGHVGKRQTGVRRRPRAAD